MADQLRVNGNLTSWGHIIIRAGVEEFSGFDSITYADKRERVKAYGTGRHHAPRGRSAGKYTTDPVKLRGPKTTVEALRAYLASQSSNGKSYGDVEFQIVVQYAVGTGSSEVPMYVELERCVIVSDSSSHEESADHLKDEIEIDTMLIRRNGRTLFDSSLGAVA
jgi:hypothetical protein